MTVEPTANSVMVSPFAVAMAGLVISTLQAPGELDVGGVKVMVRLSMVVTVGSGRLEMMVSAALAVGAATKVSAPKRAEVRRSAVTFVLIGPLSFFATKAHRCDTPK